MLLHKMRHGAVWTVLTNLFCVGCTRKWWRIESLGHLAYVPYQIHNLADRSQYRQLETEQQKLDLNKSRIVIGTHKFCSVRYRLDRRQIRDCYIITRLNRIATSRAPSVW